MDFHGMKRKELQGLCKKHQLPANLTNLEMIEKLSSVFKAQEKEKSMRRMRSCLKDPAEILSETDSDIVNRNLKKVRFSPENDVFEISGNKRMGAVNYRMRGVEARGDQVVENEDSPVRVTRASKQASFGGHKVLISSPVVVQKRGKNAVKEMEKNDKELRLVVDLNDDAADVRSEVFTGKLLRNRKVDGVLVSKKNVRKRITQKRSEGSSAKVSENEAAVADGGITQLESGFRRSTRNVKRFEESEGLNGTLGNGEIVGKRKIESRNQSVVDASSVDCKNKSKLEVRDEDVHVSSRKSLRQRGAKNTSAKSSEEASDNNGLTADGRSTRPEKALRWSRRNMEETEDLNGLNSELANIDLVGKRNIRSEKGSAVDSEAKTETGFKNEDAHMVSRKSLRRRSQLRTNAKNSDDVFEKKALALDGGIAEPEKALRRSKRNGTEFVKFESLQKELGKAEMAGRRNTRSRTQFPMKDSIVNTESGTKSVIHEASEVLFEVEKPLQHTDQRVNKRRTNLGKKVEGEIEAAVQFDEPALRQTRFSIRRKSVVPRIKKVRTEEHLTGNLGRNKTGEKKSSNKSKELKKGSKTEGHVRRSRRNASGDDSLVISDGADAIGISVGKIKTRKRGREAIQVEEPLRHTGRHVKRWSTDFGNKVEGETKVDEPLQRGRRVKRQHTNFGDKAERETEVAVKFDEPAQRQTRFGSRQKSVMPKIKKVRIKEPVAGNLRPNRIIGETDSPNQSSKLFIGQKGSETRGHVRRSRRNASGDDSLANSDGANAIGGSVERIKPRKRGREAIQEEEIVETEHAPVVEEPSRQFILSASKSESDRSAYVTRKCSRKKPESSSKSPISEVQASLPEYTSSLGGAASVDVQFSLPEVPRSTIDPVSSTSDIVKDKIACATLQDSSNEANAETPNLAEAGDLVLTNKAETSASCSVKLQTDQELEIEISTSKHASVAQEPSRRFTRSASKHASIAQEPPRRFTRSATKGKTDRPVYRKLSQKKPQRSSKLPLLEVEASLPEFTSIVEEPAIVDVQSLPEVSVCTSDQVLCTSDISRENADFSIPQGNSTEANARTPKLEESKALELMNTSPSEFLKLQTDHVELELDIAASEHAIVEKPASVDVQLSLPEVAGSSIDPVSSTSHIGKDNTETPTLVHLKPAENFNVALNASRKYTTTVVDGFSFVDQIDSIGVEEKLQTSKDVLQSFIVVAHDAVVEGASTHEEQPIYQLSLPEVAGSTIDPVSITGDIGENTTCAVQQGNSTEANAETPNLAHLKPAENLDVAGDAELEEKPQDSKDVQPSSTVVVDRGVVVEQATIHEEQPIAETGELDEFHGTIRQEPDQPAGCTHSGGLEKDNGNASKEVGEASFVDLHDAAVSTFLMEEENDAQYTKSSVEAVVHNDARDTESPVKAVEAHNSSSKSKMQEKEEPVPKGIRVTDEPSMLDAMLSEPDVCETEPSTFLYCNKEVLEDSHQKRTQSAPKSCLKKQESCTGIYVELSKSKEVGYSLAERNKELEPKASPSLSTANSVPDSAAEDGKSCFHMEQNSIESAEVYEGGLLKDVDDGFEIIKKVSILDSSNRERSDSKMSREVKIDGEDSDHTADMQEPASVSQVVDYNLGGGKSMENEFDASSISLKELLSCKVNIESKYKEEFPFDQQLILQHNWVESNIADRDAEIFDGIMSKGEDSVYDDGVGAGSQAGGEEAIAVEKIKLHGSSTGETSRQVIAEKNNDKVSAAVNDDLLYCQTPLKASDGSMVVSMGETSMKVGGVRELQEVTRAKDSDDQCPVKVISSRNTEKEITCAGSNESEQENQLKTLFETPDTTTRYNEKQISIDDVENSVVAISLEKTLDQTIHGRLSQGKPLEMVESKEIGDNEGSVLRSKREEIIGERSSSIEHANFCTGATLPEINSKDFEVCDTRMTAELIESTTRCRKETDALKDQNNEQIISLGPLWIGKATFEAGSESAEKNLNTQSASAGGLLEEGGSHHVLEDILSTAALKADDCGKNTNDHHSFVESVPQLDVCFGEIDRHLKGRVQGMDERAFLVQGNVDFMKAKDVETPKHNIVATDANKGIDLADDTSGVPTEEILINEDAMKEDYHAKFLHSNVTQTSTEETNEACDYSDYLHNSSEYGAMDLIVDSVMFSSELNSFMRADEVQEEKYNVFSHKNNFILGDSEDAGEEQETLTISQAEEQLYKPVGEQLGEKDTELINILASDVPSSEEHKISEDINVAIVGKAHFESQCNVHLTSSTKQDENLTNTKNTTMASMGDGKPFVGDKYDVEASELTDASASSEAKRMGDQSATYTDA